MSGVIVLAAREWEQLLPLERSRLGFRLWEAWPGVIAVKTLQRGDGILELSRAVTQRRLTPGMRTLLGRLPGEVFLLVTELEGQQGEDALPGLLQSQPVQAAERATFANLAFGTLYRLA